MYEIETDRLIMRPLAESDFDDFAALHADEEAMAMMRHGHLDRGAARRLFDLYRSAWAEEGIGMWRLAPKAHPETFAGVAGFWVRDDGIGIALRYALPIGWRRQGFAREAAKAALDYGFREHGLERVVAVVQPGNPRSRMVLHEAGMKLIDGTFNGIDGRCLYALDREAWQAAHADTSAA